MIPTSAGDRPNWHTAVRQAMKKATEEELIDRYGSAEVSFNYRWEHVTAVAELADRLAGLTGADRDVVEAAAWLHDVRKGTRQQHALEGAAFARTFLPSTDFPADKIEAVAQAIEDHIGLWRDEPLTNLEAMVLWDADKLSKIGLTAVFHWTGGSLAGNKMTHVRDLVADSQRVDWQEKTVASMHTEPARRAAQVRLEHFNWFWQALEEELNGDDLLPPGGSV